MPGSIARINNGFLRQEPVTSSASVRAPSALRASIPEIAVSAASLAITLPFVATGLSQIFLATVGIGLVASNVFLRNEEIKVGDDLSAIRALQFSILDKTTRDVVTHEAGHALAARALLGASSKPQITIEPFLGGVTQFVKTDKLTSLGRLLGHERSWLVMCAAGSGLQFLFALGGIVAAHLVQDSHPEASTYLTVASGSSILQSVLYAISALYEDFPGHDFVYLAAGGIHPLACAAFFATTPFLLKAFLNQFMPIENYSEISGGR